MIVALADPSGSLCVLRDPPECETDKTGQWVICMDEAGLMEIIYETRSITLQNKHIQAQAAHDIPERRVMAENPLLSHESVPQICQSWYYDRG